MARHSQHDIIDAVHRLATAAADAGEDQRALDEGAASLASLAKDRPLPVKLPAPAGDAAALLPQAPAAPRSGSIAA
jgi:glycine C-acetyltransferase